MGNFNVKMHQIRFSAGLHPDPLGESTALTKPHSWIYTGRWEVTGREEGWEEGKKEEKRGNGRQK